MNFNTTKLEKLRNELNKSDFDTIFILFRSLNLDDNNKLFIYRDFDTFCDENFPNSPSMAARAAYLGNFNLTDDFFGFDEYGNITSYKKSDLKQNLLDQIIAYLNNI